MALDATTVSAICSRLDLTSVLRLRLSGHIFKDHIDLPYLLVTRCPKTFLSYVENGQQAHVFHQYFPLFLQSFGSTLSVEMVSIVGKYCNKKELKELVKGEISPYPLFNGMIKSKRHSIVTHLVKNGFHAGNCSYFFSCGWDNLDVVIHNRDIKMLCIFLKRRDTIRTGRHSWMSYLGLVLEKFAEHDEMEMLEYLINNNLIPDQVVGPVTYSVWDRDDDDEDYYVPVARYIISPAASRGHLKMLQYLWRVKPQWFTQMPEGDSHPFNEAITNHQEEVMTWVTKTIPFMKRKPQVNHKNKSS